MSSADRTNVLHLPVYAAAFDRLAELQNLRLRLLVLPNRTGSTHMPKLRYADIPSLLGFLKLLALPDDMVVGNSAVENPFFSTLSTFDSDTGKRLLLIQSYLASCRFWYAICLCEVEAVEQFAESADFR